MIRLKNWFRRFTNFSQPLLVGVCAFIFATSVFANPILDNIAAGQVTIQQDTNSTIVNQTSQQAIVNWQSFNIGAQESTHFQQPAGGVALNRINPSQGVSEIYGRLTATGQIILVNPAGIFFGPGSYVNVGGLIASTANISNEDFLNNYYHFANVPGYNGAIVNQGQIIAAEHGLVALVGGAVSNEGYIQANMGHAVLASGDSFTMSFAGNDLIGFSVDSGIAQRAQDKNGNESSVGVSNTGSIIANGGRILISAKDAAGVLDKVINMQGIAQTLSVSDGANKNDGEIILMGDDQRGIVSVSGKLNAAGKNTNNKGGNITITGHNILLTSTADLDVSGNIGGGNIHIGGNYQGQGPLPNAKAVVMLAHANINADANSAGDGGRVIIWSDDYTNVSGSISARGGSVNGNGGFIETSSKDILNIGDLTVNTNAENGLTGTWLLDPYDVFITSSADSGGSFNGSNPNVFTPSATANILNTTLNTNLNNANVTITTTGAGGDAGNISVNAPITWSSGNTLLLQATNNIYLNADITALNGGLSLSAVNSSQSITSGTPGSPSATGVTANINVGNFNLVQGQWYQSNATLPTFSVGNSFSLASDAAFGGPVFPARFLRVAGGDGNSTGTAYQLVDIYGIQGINSGSDTNNATSLLSKFYILANDIDATGTATWNNNQGFHPIGYFYATGAGNEFNGNFNGNNKVIDGLHINRSQTDIGCCGDMGSALFAVTWHPSIYNLGLTNVNITSQNNRAAGLVAFASWQANPGWGGGSGASFYNNYVTGNVTSYGSQAGGLFGYVGDGNTINSSYSAATVTSINSSAPAGGLIAYLSSGSTVTNSYSTGTVRALGATGSAGGFVGTAESGTTITNAYSSGLVYSTNGNNSGGFIGTRNAGSTVNNGFWDTDTSLQSVGVGSGSTTGVTGGCFGGVCTNGGTANLALASAYTGWTIANSGFNVATAPGSLGTWLILDNQTRPMLWSEWNPSVGNAHQLQLMSTALTANYSLARNIDVSNSGSSPADVWGTGLLNNVQTGKGFLPIGNDTDNFTGSFDGNNYTIDGLYINRPASNYVGLFGVSTSLLQDVGLTNVNITGASYVGSLTGYALGDSASVYNSYVKNGSVSGSYMTGGLIGLGNSYITGWVSLYSDNVDVTGGSGIGGIAGGGQGGIYSSYNINGTVNGPNGASAVGGIVGWWDGNPLIRLYNGSNINVGTSSYYIGGIVGEAVNGGNITNAYNTGTINVGAGSAVVGGIAGVITYNAIINSYNSGAFTTIAGISELGGVVGRLNEANVYNSFWDTNTTGLGIAQSASGDSSTAGLAGNRGMTTAQMMKLDNFILAANGFVTVDNAWSITKTPSTNATAPTTAWYIFDATNAETGNATASSYTRPILMMEYQTNITNAHGLQLMGSTLGGNYTLANDIDMTNSFNNTAEIWGTNRNTATGYGFVAAGYSYQGNANLSPVTQFVGTFNGQNHTISNLYVNKPHFGDTDSAGLFIETGAGAVISNLILMNASVTGASQGYASQGGLVGVMRGGTISNVSYYGTVTGNGGNTGGLVGNIDYGTNVVSNSSFNGTVSANWILSVGGLAGSLNNGTISNSYSSGSVVVVDNSRSPNVGGLVGTNSGTISNSYSLSSVDGGSASSPATKSGGLVGVNAGTINTSYSTGSVTSYNTYGGFIGNNAGTVNSSVWDTATSGQVSAIGSGSNTGMVGMTTTQMMTLANFTTPGNGFVTSAWNITATPSTTSIAPTNTWFIFDGATRPMLMMENKTSIRDTHQLQMMGAALGGIYRLENNVDFATTTAADVWGTNISSVDFATPSAYPTTTGFVPIGNNTYNFNGSFDGQDYTINKVLVSFPAGSSTSVYSNFPSYVFSYQGFFGQTGIYSQIENIGITNSSVIGNSNVAGVVGYNQGRIYNANYSGYVWGNSNSGGITGYNTNLIENSHNSAYVATHGNSGGIAGNTSSGSIIINTYNTGRMYVNIYNNFAGGLVGVNNGMIANSYNTGAVAGSGALYNGYFGGLVGDNYGHIRQSYNLGQVSGQFLNNNIGGIAGNNRSTGVIANTYNYGFVFTGAAISVTSIGGIAGANAGNIINAFSIGSIAPNGVPAAGIVGDNTGTVANAFWDINATSAGSGFGFNTNSGTFNATSGGFGSYDGSSGVAMNALATYCNSGTCAGVTTRFDFTNIWRINEGYSYPYLRAFYSTAPRSIVAISPAVTNSSGIRTASLVVNGAIQDSTFSTGANGLVYMLEGYNNVSGVNNTIADNTPILIYTTSTLSNAAEIMPVINIGNPSGSIYIAPGLMQTNTLLAGHSGTSSLNNTLLNQAIGSLGGSNSNIFYTAAGSDLTLKSSRSFVSSLNTTYTVNGNIAATSANITMNGPVVVSAASPTISTTTSGNINVLNDVAGGGNTLTINTVGTTSSITGIISNLTSFTKSGTGTLTLSGASTFDGVVNVNAGTLSYSTIADVSGGASNLGAPTTAGNGTINIGATGILMYTGTGHSSNRVMNITADGGTINASGSGALTLTGGITGNNNNVVLTGTGLATESGDITNSAATLTKTGAGTWTLSGNNSYGTTTSTIITGGTLAISSDANLGVVPGAFDADNVQLGSGGTLQTNGTFNINSNRGLTLTAGGGTVQSNSGTLTYAMVVAGAQALGLSGPGNMILTSNITAPSSITSSANLGLTFGGTALTASAGALTLNSATTLSNSGTVTLTATGASSDITTNGLTWAGSNTVNLVAGRNIIINGAISGSSGNFNLTAVNASQSITTGASGSVNVNNFNLLQGQWYQNTGALPAFNVGNNFQITGTSSPATSTSQFIRATSGNGAGTPYVLVDVYGLQGIGSNATTITQNFNLGGNIDASSTIRWNNDAGFVPIALTSIYSGIFNGLNNSISNLYINLPTTNNVGLFSSTNVFPVGPAMSNISVLNANVTGSSSVGILAGISANQISNVFVSGNVNSFTDNATNIGGMVGNLNQPFSAGTISNSGSNVNINVYGNNVTNIGGLAGNVFASTIQNSYSIGNITLTQSGSYIGGIAGQIYVRNFQNNYAGGNITILGAGTKVGGAFGISNGTTLTNIYSTTNISVGPNSYGIGGFIGHWFTGSSINQSYSSGLVTAGSGSTGVGGFAGLYDAITINNSYWDIGSSGQTAGFGASTGYSPTYSITNFNGGCFGNTACNATAITNASNAAGTPVDLSLAASYTGFTFDATGLRTGNTSPGSNWVMINGMTRPMLSSEWNLNIRTPHQVQLMNFATGGNYQLNSNVEFKSAMNSLSEVWATNLSANQGSGFVPIGTGNMFSTITGAEFTGTFNGNNNAINNLYSNRPSYLTVALFGATGDNVTIQNLTLNNVNFSGYNFVGGLIGNMLGGGTSLISNVGITGSLTTTGNGGNSFGIGGLVGQIKRSGTTAIQNTYSTANINVAGPSTVGGLFGYTEGASGGTVSISNSYASGSISNTANVTGGFIGWTSVNTLVSNSFWDIGTTGKTAGYGVGGPGNISGLYGGCFGNTSCNGSAITNATNAGGSAVNLAQRTTYSSAGWSITETPSPSATAPGNTWFIFNGSTRPILMTENNSSVSNSHQVQMMGAALGKNYSLSNNIYTAADMDNLSEVWGSKSSTATGGGYVPISNYSGVLNGNKFAIDGLYIRGYTQHGLFASTTSTAYIMNVGITGGSVTGGSYVAGLVGLNAGRILNSYNTSTLNASGSYLNYMGGITGYNTGVITNSYNSGSIGTLADGGAFATVGGVAGYNSGSVSTSYNTGTINGLTTYNGNFGGIVGTNAGTIANSFNAGVVTAYNSINATGFGGLVGNNTGTITNSLSYGYVGIPGGSNFTAGFAGINSGTITGSFWNSDTSGRASAVASGSSTGVTGGCFNGVCTNGGTANLASNVSPTTYTTAGWDMTNIWNVIEDQSYPYLRAFYTSTPRVVAGSSPAAAGDTVNIAVNGAVLDTVTAGANGEFYFFAGYNNISGVNRAIADSSPALIYLTSGASVSNAVALTPASTGSLSGTTSLTLTASTVTAGNNSTSGALSNSLLRTALGSLSNSNILYAVDGSNNLTLNSGRGFQTSPTTAYTIDGSIAATGANIIFNTAATIGSSNPVISTTTSGNITFGSTITGGGNPFTVSNPTSTTATFSGVISGSGTSLTKLGAGALTLSSASNSFTGGLFLNGGTLSTSSLPSAAGNSIIGTGNLSINNAATLSYTGATGTFNRAVTIASGGGTIQTTNASANTLTLSGGITANGSLTFDTTGAGPTNILLTTAGMTGAGNITKIGSGILTFAVDNSYSGTTTISGGSLSIGNGGTAGTLGTGDLTNNGILSFNRSDAVSYSAVLSGTGGVTKLGAGTLTLSGANTYEGKTTISAGTVSINTLANVNGVASALGIPTSIANGTIDIGATGVLQYTGTGHASDRVINLTASGGTVDASGSGALLLSGGITNSITNANLILTGTNPGSASQSGVISLGSGTLTKNGTGTWTLGNAANTYTGATSITGGTLSVNTLANGGSNSSLGATAAGTAIALSGGATLSYTGGTVSMNRNFSTSGSGGTIQATTAAPLTLTGNIANNGTTLIFDTNGGDITSSGVISSTGILTKNGANVLTLGTANTYTGQTIINNGTLSVSVLNNGGSASSLGATAASTPILIGSATPATLLYTGSGNNINTNRQISINGTGGGTIATSFNWNSPGFTALLALNGAINGNGYPLTFDINRGISTGGGLVVVNSVISGLGTTLTKTNEANLSLTNANTFSGGSSLTSGLVFIGNGSSLGTGSITVNAINGLFFGANMTVSNNIILNNGGSISFFGNGSPYFPNVNNSVTLSGNISGTGGLQFYSFNQLTLSGNNTFGTTGSSSIFASNISSLNISSDANLGNASSDIYLSTGATLTTTGTFTIANTRALNFTAANATLSNAAGTLTFNGSIFGSSNFVNINSAGTTSLGGTINTQNLALTGAGTITLSGSNTISTGTSYSGGTLNIGNNNALGSAALSFNGGTLQANSSGINIANNIVLGAAGAFSGSNDFTLSGAISGGFGVTKSGSSTLTLTGSNTYTTTTINAGTLQIGNGGTTGSLGSGAVTNNGALTFNRSNAITVSNAISGSGALTQMGTGTTILTGSNNYSGGTTINAGSLQIGNGGASGSIAGNVVNNANLAFNLSSNFSQGNIISGTGTLTQQGSGKLVLSGLNTYSGGTTLTNGTLELGTSSMVVLGSITQGPVGLGMLTMTGGSLMATNSFAYTLDNPYTVNGTVNIAPLSGGITFNGHGTLASGTFTVNPYSTTFMYGNLSGPGNLTIATTGGGGALRIYSPDNSFYTGTTTVTTARLELMTASNALGSGLLVLNTSSGASLGTFFTTVTLNNDFSVIGAGEIVGTSALIMNGNGDLSSGSLTIAKTANVTTTFNGAISGANDLIQNSTSGTVILTGNNSYANTTITSGTLQVGNGGTTGTLGNGTVTNNDALIVDRSNDITIANLINGTGTLNKNGAGILSITNANGYTGQTTVNAGTLSVGNNASLGTNKLTLNGGTLQTEMSGVTLANDITLGGSSIISNNGLSFILSGDIDGANGLTFNGAGTTRINGAIGNTTKPSSLTANSDLIVNGGSVQTTGNQLYANDVTLGSTTTFANDGVGTQSITFNGTLNTGTNDVTLSGTNSGSYQFTINDINATSSTITVSASLASTNNSLLLNTGGTQNFVLTSNNTGTVDGITNVTGFNFTNIHNLNGGSGGLNSITAANTPNIWNINTNNGGGVTNLDGSFANMQDLIGGTDSDIFNFTDGVSISGTVDGGDANDDSNHFDFGTIQDSLMLTLNMPILNVFDAGVVRTSSSALIVSFSQIQRAIGYGNGFITLPNTPNLKLFADTRPQYANNPKYGAIGDPFYFSNWTIGNPPPPPPSPTPTPAPGNTFNAPVASIVNQPVFNAVGNNNYSPPNMFGYLYDPSVVNKTYVDPILNTTILKAGSACYTTSR